MSLESQNCINSVRSLNFLDVQPIITLLRLKKTGGVYFVTVGAVVLYMAKVKTLKIFSSETIWPF